MSNGEVGVDGMQVEINTTTSPSSSTSSPTSYASDASTSTVAVQPQPSTPLQPDGIVNEERTIIIHMGSKEIRFGFNDDYIGPQTIENCIAIPTTQKAKRGKKKPKPENIRNKEILRIRGQLLVDRKLIPEDKVEQEVYFEEITLKDSFPQQTQHPFMNLQRRQMNVGEEVIRGALFGRRAIEKAIENDPNDRYELFYPFWKGKFNTGGQPHHTFDSIDRNCDFIEAILMHVLKDRLKLTIEKIREAKCVLVLPDECLEAGKGIELHYLLGVVFNRIQFNELLIHKESVTAALGAGMLSEVCVVDLGESKTTLSIIEDGETVSRSELPYGGVHVTRTLLWILKQCNFPMPEGMSFDNTADQQTLERIRNEYCHLEEGTENFQSVDFVQNGTVYKMDIGDPLLLAPLGYFYPKLFGRECKLSEKAGEEDPYDEVPNENFWTEENMNAIKSQSEPPAKKQKVEKSTKTKGKKKKKKKGKKSKSEKDEEAPKEEKKGKLKTALAIDRAIIRLIKSSGMGVDTKINKKKGVALTILLIGGLSHIRGFRQYLEKRLLEHYNTKNEGKQIKLTILTNDRDRNMDVRFMSWNGGLCVSHVEQAKNLWITRREYIAHGDRIVFDKSVF